jgi:hypothetical protein
VEPFPAPPHDPPVHLEAGNEVSESRRIERAGKLPDAHLSKLERHTSSLPQSALDSSRAGLDAMVTCAIVVARPLGGHIGEFAQSMEFRVL